MKVKNIGSNITELEFEDGTLVLVSYETPVAARVFGLGKDNDGCALARTSKKWSATTTRHINKWMRSNFSEDAPKRAKEMPQDWFDNLLSVGGIGEDGIHRCKNILTGEVTTLNH